MKADCELYLTST